MNEEEKQAYNYLEKYIKWETFGERNLEGDIHTILNLIDKQQEKILELKQFKEEVINIIKYADDTAEPTYWNIRKLLGE